MSEIIKSYFTRGLCSTCYCELPAKIEYRCDGAAYITKTCANHGYEEFMIERSWEFWDQCPQTNPNNLTWQFYNQIYVIEVTDRCNVMCKHCYHQPNNKIPDKPKEFIISKIISSPYNDICLMGAEPTMRDDLSEIISTAKATTDKKISIYTNGIRLAESNFVERLQESKLNSINISVHNPKYHKDYYWNKISNGIDIIINTDIFLGQISFTVENIDEVRYAVEKILWFKDNNRLPLNFCIRSPANIGTPIDEEIFASDIVSWIKQVADERGLVLEKHPNGGSNPYHVAYLLDNMFIQVIHWAGVKNVDVSWMNMGPWAEFVPLTFGTFHLQTILRDGWKKGWWQGQRLISNQ